MAIDLNQFTTDAVRTESQIKNVVCNQRSLVHALKLFIASGNMLDQMKKHIFYGSDFDLEKYGKTIQELLNDVNDSALNLQDFGKYPNALTEQMYDDSIDPRIFHALIGIATESTELAEALLSYIETSTIDLPNVGEENGDIAWYQAIFYDASGLAWEDSLVAVIEKLRARYPEKFNQTDAEIRNLEAEREILEKQIK
jgi:NTP pyrophosphatase (non-canonical NTP hydrolase)